MISLRMNLWLKAFCALILATCSPLTAIACDCRGPATCERLHAHDATFVGDVLSGKVVHEGEVIGTYRVEQTGYLFRVRVVETFSGPSVGQEVFVKTGLGGGDCAYIFKVGHRYLIDAFVQENMLLTSICTLTGPATPDSIVLRELRANAAGKRVPDLEGTVAQDGPPLRWGEEKPLQGVRVSLQSADGRLSLQAVTDRDGVYILDDLPGGTYRVTVRGLPSDLTASGSNLEPYLTDEIGELRVPDHATASAACHLWISAGPSGNISGHISSSEKVLSNVSVSVYSLGKEGQKGELVRSSSPKPDGDFRLPYLPAGRYIVVFERGPKLKGPSIDVNLADGEQRDIGETKLK
jgi:hypothetical protein